MNEIVLGCIFMLLSVLVACFSQILLKSAAVKTDGNFVNKLFHWKVIVGYFFFFLSSLLSIFGLRYLDLRFSPLFQSTSFIWIILLSYIFFKEIPSKRKIYGALVIVFGIIVFSI